MTRIINMIRLIGGGDDDLYRDMDSKVAHFLKIGK